VVDSHDVAVEECGEWEEFGEMQSDDVKEFLSCDGVKLIGQVKKDSGARWELESLLGSIDVLLYGELHRLDDEVRSVINSDGEVIWEEVGGELGFEGACYMCSDDTADGGGYAEGS